jgi:hypothetical protein
MMKITGVVAMRIPCSIAIIMILVPLVGCGRQSDNGKVNALDHSVSQESQQAQTKSSDEGKMLTRSKLPFTFKGQGKVMQLPGAFTLDSHLNPSGPAPPFGNIYSLSVGEVTVELLDTELKNGMLATKEFGDLQVVVVNNVAEFHGTDEQRKKIESFLGKKKRWW